MEKAKDHSTVTVDLTAVDGTASKLARAAPSIIPSFSLSSPSSSTPSTPSLGFTAAARQWLLSSMFIRVPLHYLKRKGVGMVLLGMILFAYLHGLLLPHDADAHVSTSPYASSSSTASSNKPSSLSLLSLDSDADETSTQNSRGGWLQDLFDFVSSSSGGGGAKGDPGLAHILHRPEQGVAPLRGVDEEGLEIVDDAYLAIGEQHMSVPPPATGLHEKGGQDTVHSADQAQHQQPITPFIDGHGSSAISIQFPFEHQRPMSAERERILAERRQFVTNMIRHAWAGYAERAAPADELRPVSGSPHLDSAYNGWAATAVDSLDTLLLAGLDKEYEEARQIVFETARKHQWRAAMQPMPLEAVKDTDSESNQNNINTETGKDSGIVVPDTINLYLGSLLSAAVLKEDPELLDAANQVAQSLLPAFKETKGALPSSILFKNGTTQTNPLLRGKSSLSETGSFQLEFRQLSQMTENQEFANLADKNLEFFMNMELKIRGLFPAYFDPRKATPKDYVASFGSLSDSFYEYLLKAFMLTDDSRFKDLYIAAVDAMHDKLVSKPHNKNDPLLVLGVYDTSTETLVPKMDHLSCFAPGMLALGARKLGRAKDMAAARGLMETCYQNYASSPTGLGAEEIAFLATPFQHGKEFERPKPQDFYVLSAGYELRAETIESLFVLYRTTGNSKYQDYAWNIALAFEKECKTSYGYSTLMSASDSSGGMTDYMPSYFLSETLKYLYLIFSPPDIASLDKILFTTQGHLIPYPLGQR